MKFKSLTGVTNIQLILTQQRELQGICVSKKMVKSIKYYIHLSYCVSYRVLTTHRRSLWKNWIKNSGKRSLHWKCAQRNYNWSEVENHTAKKNNFSTQFSDMSAGKLKRILQRFWEMDFIERVKLTEKLINPFVPNAPFLYSLKTSENLFWCFEEVEKECIGNEWVKEDKDSLKTEEGTMKLIYEI